MEKKNYLQNTLIVMLLAFLCCFLWGSAFPSIKIGYKLFSIDSSDTGSILFFAGCRFFLAGILTIIFGCIMRRKLLVPKKDELYKVGVLSLLQTSIQYFFFYVGLAHTTGVKASIIIGSQQFVAIIMAALLFRQEKLSGNKLLGCVLGFVGVILVNLTGSGLEFSIHWNGELFMMISSLSAALSSVMIKIFSKDSDPVMLSGWQFVTGGCILTIIGKAMGGAMHAQSNSAFILLIYMALISSVAYSLWAVLLKYNPVSKVTIFGFSNPVFGVILSSLILHESGNSSILRTFIALILVSTGIYAVNKDKNQ